MAKIMTDSAQEAALKEINENLKTIKEIDRILNRKGEYTISLTNNNKTYGKVRIDSEEKLGKATHKILEQLRRGLAKSIEANAKKFNILLDEKEEELLVSLNDKFGDAPEEKPDYMEHYANGY